MKTYKLTVGDQSWTVQANDAMEAAGMFWGMQPAKDALMAEHADWANADEETIKSAMAPMITEEGGDDMGGDMGGDDDMGADDSMDNGGMDNADSNM